MGAVRHFFGLGLIVGRDAFYGGSHVNSVQFQPVIHVSGVSLVCISSVEKRLHKEVGTPIPGEHSSGPIPTVSCRSQPYHENRSRDVSETGNGSAPVVPTQKPLLLHTSY